MNSLRVTSINKMLDWLNLWCIIYGIAESLIELSRSLKLHRQNWHGASSSGIRFLSELDRDQNWTKKEDEKKSKGGWKDLRNMARHVLILLHFSLHTHKTVNKAILQKHCNENVLQCPQWTRKTKRKTELS